MVRTRNKKVTPLTHTHSKFEVDSYTLCWTISRFLFDANRLFTAFGGAHRQWWGERVCGLGEEREKKLFNFLIFWIYTVWREGEERKVRFCSLMHTYWNIKFCSGSFSSLFTRNSILFDINFVCLRSSKFLFRHVVVAAFLKKFFRSFRSFFFISLSLLNPDSTGLYTQHFYYVLRHFRLLRCCRVSLCDRSFSSAACNIVWLIRFHSHFDCCCNQNRWVQTCDPERGFPPSRDQRTWAEFLMWDLELSRGRESKLKLCWL